jgi:hypothetical protein
MFLAKMYSTSIRNVDMYPQKDSKATGVGTPSPPVHCQGRIHASIALAESVMELGRWLRPKKRRRAMGWHKSILSSGDGGIIKITFSLERYSRL